MQRVGQGSVGSMLVMRKGTYAGQPDNEDFAFQPSPMNSSTTKGQDRIQVWMLVPQVQGSLFKEHWARFHGYRERQRLFGSCPRRCPESLKGDKIQKTWRETLTEHQGTQIKDKSHLVRGSFSFIGEEAALELSHERGGKGTLCRGYLWGWGEWRWFSFGRCEREKHVWERMRSLRRLNESTGTGMKRSKSCNGRELFKMG